MSMLWKVCFWEDCIHRIILDLTEIEGLTLGRQPMMLLFVAWPAPNDKGNRSCVWIEWSMALNHLRTAAVRVLFTFKIIYSNTSVKAGKVTICLCHTLLVLQYTSLNTSLIHTYPKTPMSPNLNSFPKSQHRGHLSPIKGCPSWRWLTWKWHWEWKNDQIYM